LDTSTDSNGHRPPGDRERSHLRLVRDTEDGRPPELVEYERATDPYANMLPGISNIRAAETLGRGIQAGRRGRPMIMVISIVLIAVLVLPPLLAALSQLVH
jgi:hypothetical protein